MNLIQPPSESPGNLRVAFIKDYPDTLEQAYQKPFIGSYGKLFTSCLLQAGLRREQCFLVCLDPQETEEIKRELESFAPDVCVLLGQAVLREAGVTTSIYKYRGTLFSCDDTTSPFFGYTCIATLGLEHVILPNMRGSSTVFVADVKKALTYTNPGSVLVTREIQYDLHLNAGEIVARLEELRITRPLVSFDIEGGVNGVTCCSVATSSYRAFIIPFYYGNDSAFSLEEECRIWYALAKMLEDPAVPKVLQNSLYDSFVLMWTHGIFIANVREDTMLKHWELFPELEKGLGFQASFYTQEPYYKDERLVPSKEVYHTYCCKDSRVTMEICLAQEKLLQARPKAAQDHYRFNMNMLKPLLYMELRGIRYDSGKAKKKIMELGKEKDILQAQVDKANGGVYLNTSSSKQMLAFLTKQGFDLPVNQKTGQPTANYEALLKMAKKHGAKAPYFVPILKIRGIRTRVQMLNIRSDDDGRVRCGYNVVGTDTGRLTCYTSPTGSGYNLQTIPAYDRDLFLADEGYYMFQCDLAGADAWTVAAWCAALGDKQMLADLSSGIKVAKVIACMTKHGPSIINLPQDILLAQTKEISKEDPLYFGSKCVQHGSNYGMGKVSMSALIFVQSEGKITLSAAECAKMQDYYFKRYPGVKRWHEYVKATLLQKGAMTSASGHTRTFGGNRTSHEVFKAALANEPQENTTYATNLAAWRLWSDAENRRPDGSLWIEPLHQVHDALVGQFPKDKAEWACEKLRSYFNNTLTIAGQQLQIPFEGGYGSSWGELTKEI